jgi:hypothetical protein
MVPRHQGKLVCLRPSILWFIHIFFTIIVAIAIILAPLGWSNINDVTCILTSSVALREIWYQVTDGPVQGSSRSWKTPTITIIIISIIPPLPSLSMTTKTDNASSINIRQMHKGLVTNTPTYLLSTQCKSAEHSPHLFVYCCLVPSYHP